jgi:PAS domain S-box-containing protein
MMSSSDDPRAPLVPPWAAHSERWLAAIVDSSDDAIVSKTLDGAIRSWNAGAERIFGYRAEEIVGRSILTLIPPELHDEERVIVERLSRRERIEHYETVRLRKGGARVQVSLSVSPICDGANRVLGAAKIARDVTESNRLRDAERELTLQLQEQAVELEQQIEEAQSLQEELEQTNEELLRAAESARDAQEEAERANEAKSRFLAMMSHELRTPLNAIAGYVDLLDLGVRGALSADQLADLQRIRVNQRTLLRLIDDVLDFAKLESGHFRFHLQPFPVDELLRTPEAYVEPLLRQKGLAYNFEPCGAGAVVYADRDKVEQIMLNLLSNALKFTGRGRIDVRCRRLPGALAIEVADTGQGVQAELLEAMFEPFVQADQDFSRRAGGTGLGLAISRELARGMRGDVVARSELGKGSTFTLVLPQA